MDGVLGDFSDGVITEAWPTGAVNGMMVNGIMKTGVTTNV